MIKFSIIVPVYNVELYLCQCIDSLLSQSFKDYEIILVDDGSTDKCPQICDDYSSKHQRIHTIHKENGGLSDARNKGIDAARGKYITFVDSDDFWASNHILSDVADLINKYTPDLIVGDCIRYYSVTNHYVNPDKIMSVDFNGYGKFEILNYLYFSLEDMKMAAWQKFVRRDIIKKTHFTVGILSEDIDWSLNIYSLVNKICIYNKPYYCYRQQRKGSITNTASQKSFDSLMEIITKWDTRIHQLDIPEKEKSIYNGYLAYQLGIAIQLIPKLNPNQRELARAEIRNHLSLFKNRLNSKTKKIYRLTKIFGIHLTSEILHQFIKIRHKILAFKCRRR